MRGVAEEAEPGVLSGRCGFGRPRPPSRLEEVDCAVVGQPEAGVDLSQLEVEVRPLVRPSVNGTSLVTRARRE